MLQLCAVHGLHARTVLINRRIGRRRSPTIADAQCHIKPLGPRVLVKPTPGRASAANCTYPRAYEEHDDAATAKWLKSPALIQRKMHLGENVSSPEPSFFSQEHGTHGPLTTH